MNHKTPSLDAICAARSIVQTPEIVSLVAEEFINRFNEVREHRAHLNIENEMLLGVLKTTLTRATMPEFLKDQIKAAIAKAEGGAK